MTEMIEKTMSALRKNNMQAYFAEKKEDVADLVKTLIKKGDTVTHGGSVTLGECGIPALLSNGDYNYLDRKAPGITPQQVKELYAKTFSADVFFTSANAITENGLLYNVDGNSNRVAAIVYGPESVIVIAGVNKIVPDMNAAMNRLKTIAAPLNTKRLNCQTPCAKLGKCIAADKPDSLIGDGCKSPERICCNYVVTAQQRHKDRIKVIIVNENLGY